MAKRTFVWTMAAGLLCGASMAWGWGGKALQQQPNAAVDADWSRRAADFSSYEWVTRPSREAVMSFTLSTEVKEIPVKPGQRVKKGDALVRARDGEAITAIEVQKVRASNRAEIESAKASLELAEVRYKRIQEAQAERATNPQEVDERRVSVDAARANLRNAENRFDEEAARLKQLEEQATRYVLQAPFDGEVEAIMIDVGATIEPPTPVVHVVNIDALWIDLPTPTEVTLEKNLKTGDKAWVMLDVPGSAVSEGAIVYVSPIADAAAGTRRVRVEVSNPKHYPPGTRARVRFDSPGTKADGASEPQRRGVVALHSQPHDIANCLQCAKDQWQAESGKPALPSVKPRPGATAAGGGRAQ